VPSLWTLEGDAELDCNGYRSDSAVTCDDKGKTSLQQKTACQLYYYRGVCLTGSAKIKNCQVETFLEGIYVENSSDIKDSTAVSQNRVGIAVKDGPGIVPRYQPREFVSQCFFAVLHIGNLICNMHLLTLPLTFLVAVYVLLLLSFLPGSCKTMLVALKWTGQVLETKFPSIKLEAIIMWAWFIAMVIIVPIMDLV